MNVGAQLPDGQVLSFPEGTPQDVVDRAVRKHLGLPVPPTADEVAQQQSVALGAERNASLGALAQGVGALGSGVEQLSKNIGDTQALLNRVAVAVAKLDATVAQAARDVVGSVMSTQIMDVSRDDKGRMVRTRVRREVV